VANRPNVASSNFAFNWNNYYKGLPLINTSAFTAPGDWTIGNGAPLYNTLRAPPYLDEDLSLGKKLFFTERISGELTIQFFNVLNRMLLNNGPSNSNSLACWDGNVYDQAQFGRTPNFGKANFAGQNCQGNTPRRGQIELRLFF
jgi:hypothetical protein